jgi:dTMP kinase
MFISFEGIDGSGKTTQIAQVADWLRAQGVEVLLTREPGGTAVGDQIRALLHDPVYTDLQGRAEFLLYAASRAQLVSQVIRPALARGVTVIADRYVDSTFAYQGYGRELDLMLLRQITLFATDGLLPDCTVYLDAEPVQALTRRRHAAAQGAEWTRLDAEAMAFHERVHAGYEQLIAAEPARFIRISADNTIGVIQNAIRQELTARYKLTAG